jgi:DNA-binding transcriptional ArsR family regulator
MEAAARALAEPRRRDILRLVRDDELSAGAIASHFDVSRPAISQHLRVLKDAGLLDERRDGTRRMYRARPEGFAELGEFLDDFWGEGLARLKSAAEADHRTQRKGRRSGRQ